MKKEQTKYSIMCAVSAVLLALIAVYSAANRSTDMIMPSVYIVDGMTIWYVMLLGILAEMAVVKFFMKETYLKSAAIALVMNLVSIAMGFITVFIAGLVVEVLFIPFDLSTFHVSHWIVNFLLIILMNAAVEGLSVKLAFRLKFKEIFSLLCVANAASFAVCILLNLSWISVMNF